jgi:hypothetical protein
MINHIQNLWPSLIPEHPHIAHARSLSESRHHPVWKITTRDNHCFAIKHHLFAALTRGKPYDVMAVEKRVTDLLLGEGMPVPKIVVTCEEHGLTVYEWCGDRTLDDCFQKNTSDATSIKVIEALVALESGFQKQIPHLCSHIAPGGTLQDTRASFAEVTTTLTDLLPDLIHSLTNQTPTDLLHAWQDILHTIDQSPLCLGPTDYNARNIVFSDAGQPHILELSKIGYDWPERRLIQYTTSLGAHLVSGRIIGLLTPDDARTYAQSSAGHRVQSADEIILCLDRHHLIFHLLAALQCLKAKHDDTHPWKNTDTRLEDALRSLSVPLSNCGSTGFIRRLFQA